MTSEGLGEIFEGDSADMCAGKFPLVSIRGRAEGLACADPGARTPIGASGNFDWLHKLKTIFPFWLPNVNVVAPTIWYSKLSPFDKSHPDAYKNT